MKAFLLRGVNKENNGCCQGRVNRLTRKSRTRKGRRKAAKLEWPECGEIQLTGKQHVIQNLFVHRLAVDRDRGAFIFPFSLRAYCTFRKSCAPSLLLCSTNADTPCLERSPCHNNCWRPSGIFRKACVVCAPSRSIRARIPCLSPWLSRSSFDRPKRCWYPTKTPLLVPPM